MSELRTNALPANQVPNQLIFWAFVSLHLLAWTLVPLFVRHTLPMDSMEGYVWGQQLIWGYDKNPFMNGWLTALAVHVGGYSGWMIYLFSQLSVALCFWAVWRLGNKMMPALYALLGVLLLEAVQYYNFHAIDFNDNTLELSCWALLILSFYQALNASKAKEALWSWLACGFFAGISMMTKYFTVVLLAPMFFYLVLYPENRHHLRSKGFYLAALLCLAIMAPHILWLFQHDFVTVTYAFDRVGAPPTFWNHLAYPWQFFYEQFEAVCPALILALILLVGKKPWRLPERLAMKSSDRRFLLFMGLGPFLCTALLSLLLGIKLRAGWGQPLFSLGGLLLLATLQPRISVKGFYRFLALFTLLFVLALGGYAKALTEGKKPSSANFPGKILGSLLTQEWHQAYGTALPYVAGTRWLAGNVAFYSADHPRVYISWNKRLSTWIDEAELKKRGAIFIWESDELLPADLQERFPLLKEKEIRHFSWLRNRQLPPVEVNVAFLPPA